MKKPIMAVRVLVILAVFSMVLTSCTPPKKVYKAEFMVLFNTITTIISSADNETEFKQQSQYIYDELEYYHRLYNIYDSFEEINNIKTINDQAGIAPVKVNKEIIDLLKFSIQMYEQTDHNVNIALGPVLRIWSRYREDGIEDEENAALPSQEELQKANLLTDIRKIIIDEKNSTVYLTEKGMSLDVGAIAKGYATQRVLEKAKKHGFKNGVISVGGNVCAVGTKEKGKPWGVGIQNPDKSSDKEITDTLYLKDSSLVSSGDYERYYTVKGVRYHHIIDAKTLFPADNFHQVTVVTEDSGIADAYSTAVFNMTLVQGQSFVESKKNVEAMWVLKDGTIIYSSGFQSYQKKP